MAENSKIGWTDHTFNPFMGCHKISTECKHCYIGTVMKRAGRIPFGGPMLTKTWHQPKRWQRQAVEQKRRFRVFTCSLSDFFHEGADQWRPDAWKLIKECDKLDWLVLTKRPERIRDRLPADWGKGYANVWLGTTCGIESSLSRVRTLAKIPARLRFISAEPLLGPVDFTPFLDGSFGWIITGCEQAGVGKRREMNLDWVRDIDKQCRKAKVAHFFKQRYEGNQIIEDGILDGKKRQAWPKVVG